MAHPPVPPQKFPDQVHTEMRIRALGRTAMMLERLNFPSSAADQISLNPAPAAVPQGLLSAQLRDHVRRGPLRPSVARRRLFEQPAQGAARGEVAEPARQEVGIESCPQPVAFAFENDLLEVVMCFAAAASACSSASARGSLIKLSTAASVGPDSSMVRHAEFVENAALGRIPSRLSPPESVHGFLR